MLTAEHAEALPVLIVKGSDDWGHSWSSEV